MLIAKNVSRQVRRYEEKQTIKSERAQHNIEHQLYIKFKNLLKNILSEDYLYEIAEKTGFQQRKRKLTPIALVGVLMIGCSNGSHDVPVAALTTMCSYLRKWFDIHLKPQSLQDCINRPETAKFIKEITLRVMSYEIDKVLQKFLKKRRKLLPTFARVLIQDSTIISLPATLSRMFKGCGGSGSEAAIKCDYILDMSHHLIIRLKYLPGKNPDASLSGDILKFAEENDLILRDLGYFNLSHFKKMIAKKCYFISRMSVGVSVYLNKTDKEPVSLFQYIEKLGIKNNGVDIDVYLGKKERLRVRLIGIKVPSDVIELRRQQYKRSRGRSQEPSEKLKEWHGYTLMVTNLLRKQVPLKRILKIYKIRWQIELFFKNMKSIFAVDKLTGENKYRILCLVFIKLAVTLIASLLYAYAQTRLENGKELSPFKFSRWLKDLGGFKEAFANGDFTRLLNELERDVDLLCKQNRKIEDDDEDRENVA